MNMRRTLTSISVVWFAALSLTGCAHAAKTDVQSVKNTSADAQSIRYQSPNEALPNNVVGHLSSYAQRLQFRAKLPLSEAENEQGESVSLNAKGDVLYVDPTQDYVIKQLLQVWGMLPHKPVVVWTHTTAAIARHEWQAEGYAQSPLPSPMTFYSSVSLNQLPVPDAYKHVHDGYQELPGILRPSQVHKWVSFFK